MTAFLESVHQKKDQKYSNEEKAGGGDTSATAAGAAENKENKGGGGGSPLQNVVELLNTLATNFDDSRIVIKTGPSMKG